MSEQDAVERHDKRKKLMVAVLETAPRWVQQGLGRSFDV